MNRLADILRRVSISRQKSERVTGIVTGERQRAYFGVDAPVCFPAVILDNGPGSPPLVGQDPADVWPRAYFFAPTLDFTPMPEYGIARRASDEGDPNPIGGIFDYKFDPLYQGGAVNMAEVVNQGLPYIRPNVVPPGTPVLIYNFLEFQTGALFDDPNPPSGESGEAAALESAIQNFRFCFTLYMDPQSEICTPAV
jgi:hypothetical protein